MTGQGAPGRGFCTEREGSRATRVRQRGHCPAWALPSMGSGGSRHGRRSCQAHCPARAEGPLSSEPEKITRRHRHKAQGSSWTQSFTEAGRLAQGHQ